MPVFGIRRRQALLADQINISPEHQRCAVDDRFFAASSSLYTALGANNHFWRVEFMPGKSTPGERSRSSRRRMFQGLFLDDDQETVRSAKATPADNDCLADPLASCLNVYLAFLQ
ncbi:hypothetical protein TNCV_3509021 [Trichonephila clavipes]|nr:hypothetical protein TNCV_3509021 [Trichonephila clavipes]